MRRWLSGRALESSSFAVARPPASRRSCSPTRAARSSRAGTRATGRSRRESRIATMRICWRLPGVSSPRRSAIRRRRPTGRISADRARHDRPEGRQGRPCLGARGRPRSGHVALERVRAGMAAAERPARVLPGDRPCRVVHAGRGSPPGESRPDPVHRSTDRRCRRRVVTPGRARQPSSRSRGDGPRAGSSRLPAVAHR